MTETGKGLNQMRCGQRLILLVHQRAMIACEEGVDNRQHEKCKQGADSEAGNDGNTDRLTTGRTGTRGDYQWHDADDG